VKVGYRAGIQWFGKLVPAEVVDASKAGIRITVNCRLRVGSWIQISVPYCKESENLFILARVAWCRESVTGNHQYGLQQYRPKETLVGV
jgi:hypothetical protein